jgi:hypothetical protein
MSLDEIAAELRAVMEFIREQRTMTAAMISSVATTRDRLQLLTSGSRHPLVRRLPAAWDAALVRLRDADQMLSGAASALVEYGQIIGVKLGSTAAAATPGKSDSGAVATAAVPTVVRDIARRLRAPPGAKTAGIATTADGAPLHDGVVVNGAHGALVDNAASLRTDDPVIPWHQTSATRTHVEGHITALMRQPEGPRDVVLVLNRPPCPGQRGCRTLLPGMLPQGSRLHVYVAGEDGNVRLFKTYVGNGRGVARWGS